LCVLLRIHYNSIIVLKVCLNGRATIVLQHSKANR
jgi:hypothetical protein